MGNNSAQNPEETNPSPKVNKGGPAFPIPFDPTGHQTGYEWNYCGGMSMREWYAGMALQGMTSSYILSGGEIPAHSCQEAATDAFRLADAMIEASKK